MDDSPVPDRSLLKNRLANIATRKLGFGYILSGEFACRFFTVVHNNRNPDKELTIYTSSFVALLLPD